MSNGHDAIVAAETRPVALRVRPDLRMERNLYQGQVAWIIKDPVGLKYYRLAEEEHAALKMLDGKTSMQRIKEELERRFPPWIVEYSELQSLLGMFHRSGLVLGDAPGQGEQLFARRKKQWRRMVISKLASVLWIRFPGVDPERILSWLYPKVRWFFTKWFLVVWCVLALSALLLVLMHLDEFYAKLPSFHQFFGPQNAVWLMIALMVSKILHELGHGLTCKHFGGECHEIGVMLLVFTPALYCDTSDSWMVGNRWHRAAVGAAGMYVEMLLASICTFIWWNTEPGLVHYVSLSTMFVCSVSTILFNSNPLLRFDGYYILSDVLEIPNLAQKSRSALIGVLRTWCLGLEWDDRLMLPPRQRLAFACYAVASVLYRWFILIAILWFLSKVFEPYGLQVLGHLMIAMSLFGLLVMPVWQVFRYFRVPGRWRQVKRHRLLASMALAATVVLAVALIPVPHRVMTTLVIQARQAERVYVEVPGVLDKVAVRPGDRVDTEQQLAVLTNLDISLEVIKLQGELAQANRELRNFQLMKRDLEMASRIPQAEEYRDSLADRLNQRLRDQTRLTLVSKSGGYVIPPPNTPDRPETEGSLATWTGTPLDEINHGTWLDSATLFCLVGNPESMEAELVIDQTDMEFIRPGQFVEIKLDEYRYKTLSGTIESIGKPDLKIAPRELSNKAGGELSTETNEAGAERPMSASYQAIVPLEKIQDVKLLPGFRGRAKIHTGTRTLGQIIWRGLFETFRFG